MKVELIHYDPLELILFTRSTRLQQSPDSYKDVCSWSQDKKMAELRHAMNTIQSSFEFIGYVFTLEDVTRAFAQQLERHRIGTSFAEQSQRAVDKTGFSYKTGPSIKGDNINAYDNIMGIIDEGYQTLIQGGADTQDARGVLPMNINTSLTFKCSLRTLHDMALIRLCVRTQGEFQTVFRAMKAEVLKVHPWAEPFIRVQCGVTGTCAFPDYPLDKCEVKGHVYDPVKALSYGGMKNHLERGDLWTKDKINAYLEERAVTSAQPVVTRG